MKWPGATHSVETDDHKREIQLVSVESAVKTKLRHVCEKGQTIHRSTQILPALKSLILPTALLIPSYRLLAVFRGLLQVDFTGIRRRMCMLSFRNNISLTFVGKTLMDQNIKPCSHLLSTILHDSSHSFLDYEVRTRLPVHTFWTKTSTYKSSVVHYLPGNQDPSFIS
ncbi:hypothetical protein CLF_105778 [Clonorchis sinensis]|uniref:Uncharacterized protein n=1 Tax=Clonorchis sinensis TaxID=79923 RepID=G7YPF0_CLOSI|nr:hypothetical protein CLF_105778 [Clonorchis sinensis]